ncbi:binding partner of ACD11 1-like isoform X1 [Durio zibethinus]|uniref:Binding partner of ACD11 1-like isoform X1 n=1 Tax=Durio zibethinus TaxID=66656 RepID=A0A6P6BHL1_DURZI|nr:binding partner of ACD11 1-like isoform X1 [Durio zibethinus]
MARVNALPRNQPTYFTLDKDAFAPTLTFLPFSPYQNPIQFSFVSLSNIVPLILFVNLLVGNSFYNLQMSVPVDHTNQSLGAVPQTNAKTNWTINGSDIRTVKVSNISLAASERDIKEFFSFSGDIQYVEMGRETENAQVAYVTFKDSQGADTAMLLTGATIIDLSVNITPVEDYQLPPEALQPNMEKKPAVTDSNVKKAEDVMSTMLAKGFVLGKDAVNKAKAFDEWYHLTSNASAAVTSIDQKMGLSEKLSIGTAVVNEKMREMDERYQVSEKTKSALAVAEHKASNAGTAILSNRYVSTGASWLSNAFNVVARAAEDVSMLTKEKVEKAEEEKKDIIYKERTGIINDFAKLHLDESSAAEPPIVPVDSTDSKLGMI